ncbi:hypothetical protein D3C73_1255760 [compost metagenome]
MSTAVEHIRLGVVTAANDDVAARDLAEVQHFFGVLGVHADHRFQRVGHRLGNRHLRPLGDHWHRLPELRGKLLTPGACRDQQLFGAVSAAIGSIHLELPTHLLNMRHFGTFFDARACTPRGAGKGRCGETRVSVAIVRCIGTALDLRAEERKAFV